MNIGQAARSSGVSAKMIRHYEQVGLFAQPQRTESGYRQYNARDVHVLRFIRHARDLGFSIPQIGELVGLWQNRRRSSRHVKALAEAHIAELQRKAQDLLAMKATLEHLVNGCHGDDRPECPILEELADPSAPAAAPAKRPAQAGHRTAGLRTGKTTRRPGSASR
ncbi:MAG: Cu(I)-responsive transcriptional regulator [Rubrivivax sp.]